MAKPGGSGWCPSCLQPVIPKCGDVYVWHWAHSAATDCDPWAEGESAWHVGWKRGLLPSACEVLMPPHRADIVLSNGVVVELQHSNLPVWEIKARERFYDRMVWIIDARDWGDRFDLWYQSTYQTFRWKHARQSYTAITRPLVLDLDRDFVFEVKKLNIGPPCGGWGHRIEKDTFCARLFHGITGPDWRMPT